MPKSKTDPVTPHENDVLFGRGFTISNHAGNQHLRFIVQSQKQAFITAQRKDKRLIAERIVDEIHNLVPPGRFLIEDPNRNISSVDIKQGVRGKAWLLVETDKAVKKVMHRLREKDNLSVDASILGQQPSGSLSFPTRTMPFGTAPSSDYLAPLLKNANAEQSGGGNNFRGIAIGPAQQQLYDSRNTNQNQNQPVGINVAASIQNKNDPTKQPVGQPIQQSNNQKSPHQNVNIQQPQAPQFGTQDAPNATFSSQAAGSLVSSGANTAQPIHHINHVQSLMQLDASHSNVGNVLNSCEPQNCPSSSHQSTVFQSSHEQSNAGFQQPDGHRRSYQQTDPSPIGLKYSTAQTSPPQPVSSTTSSRHQELSVNEPAISLANISNNHGATTASPIVSNDSFFGDLTFNHNHHPTNSQRNFQTITLRQWIDTSMPRFINESVTPGHLTEEMSSYIKSAILLVIKLTEFLMNHADTVPPASITCENVLVQLEQNQKSDAELIYQVAMKSCVEDLGPGANMPHLYSLGVVLYEVFSFQSGKDAANAMAGSLASVGRLSLSKEAMSCDRPTKRSQPISSDSRISIVHGEFVSNLEVLGIPRSLCSLVGNLLECIQGDLQSEDAYRSLADVQVDLCLMRDDPSYFLDNLRVEPASFKVRNKLYGRRDDSSTIEQLYQLHMNGGCGGILLSGGAGVGKSSLVSTVTRTLASENNALFSEAKFDQNEGARPLSTIGSAFNSLCDLFAQDATQSQLEVVDTTLRNALGSQAALLIGALPSLAKLIACSASVASGECIDLAASMQFLFMKLLEALSEHKRVLFFLDDLQFADAASLILISRLLSNRTKTASIFFACCYRDDFIDKGGPFALWLSASKMFQLEVMELKNISIGAVSELVSETLHLSPRITRPLASILHRKTMGNPLFLRQMLDLLRDQGCIYLKLNPRQWAWDIDKIRNLELSDNVLALLIKEMQRLHTDVQFSLNVASCIGGCVKYSIFDILSLDLGLDLRRLLDQAVQKGYMIPVDNTKIRFAHDKIQQAAYEMFPSQRRLENHVRFGLALTSHSLNADDENDDELFFIAVHQVNRGGPNILQDSKQRAIVAGLNLKAGKRSMGLSDFSTALSLFEHGISFLDKETCWIAQYALSLELFDAAVETACALNDAVAVRRLSAQGLANARCNDDKLNCLYAVVKTLRVALKFQDSKKVAFTMLEVLGERLPRPMDDVTLATDIQEVKPILMCMSDESVLNMKETRQKKRDELTINLLQDLNFLYQYTDTKRIADVSLRMVQITLSNGLCCMSPLAYAQFALVLVTMEEVGLGYRLGTLALRLLDKINAQRYTSAVVALVGTLVSWVAEPLQSIVDSHLLGYQYGQRHGDVVAGSLNHLFYLQASYLSGQSLPIVRVRTREFVHRLLQRKQNFMLNGACCVYLQTVSFIEGLKFEDKESGTERIPSWDGMALSRAGSTPELSLIFSSHLYMRSFLFKQYSNIPQEGLLDRISEKNVPLRPLFWCGVFFEGLVSFQLTRHTDRDEHRRKGEGALTFMRNWSMHSKWNFENKHLLLEAEMMNISGYHHEASQLYEDSIRSSHEHEFIHEEAIASELAATFFYERGINQKSHLFFMHSANCYKKWGALAIAKQLENDIIGKFGSDFEELEPIDHSLASILAPKGSSKKRSGIA